MEVKKLMVPTPSGPKFHGEIRDDKEFFRRVFRSKDLMRIFDAWSMHPACLRELQKRDIKRIKYYDEENKKLWVTNRKHWENRETVRRGNFAGGDTLYLPLKHWHDIEEGTQKKLPLDKDK